ncbi:GGDEF and EAL domain-containing protein [Oleiagrimonas sp. C23AA]|uniref:sensor domain-containing protein n=1 Tax=Oleiagrimonas sp. C23AA TaxID=2719047 RepID=UPI001422471D|nr:GGDEF and EAL domain-containing protein [Oleiagrimonas sp. C23AA]NII11949.1 EAL domain-containing protein [Oleiagrimonas sp. C23AA]
MNNQGERTPEAWFGYTAERMPAILAYIGSDHRYRYGNERYSQWLGLDRDSLYGRTVEQVLGRAMYERIRPQLEQALAGEPVNFERLVELAGRQRYLHLVYQPDVAADGRVQGVVVLATDITSRHELEQRLRESEARFSGAFAHAAIGMALVSTDGGWLQVNPALCRMLGYEEGELLTTTFQDITHPDDLEKDMGLLYETLEGKRRSYQIEKRYFHRDGRVVHVFLAVSLVRGASDEPLYFVSQIQNITQRKAYEEALFHERERAEVTLKSIGDAVITVDPHLCVNYLNPVAETMTGWSLEHAIGRHIEEVLCLVDLHTGRPLSSPLREAIRRNVIVDLEESATLMRRDGFSVAIEDSAAPIHDRYGRVIGGVMVFHDVSEARRTAMRMTHMAKHDALTDLPNRSLLKERLDQAVAQAAERRGMLAVLFIDVDRFKQVNDSLGHDAGDRLLLQIATLLRDSVNEEDTVARIGGDEFVIVKTHLVHPESAGELARALIDRCHAMLPATVRDLGVALSIGISAFPGNGAHADALIHSADTAMYEAKQAGHGAYRFFTAELNARTSERVRIETGLRSALRRDELRLHYQPLVDMEARCITGAEALLRWQVDDELVMPARFICVAEESGLILDIGRWVLQQACRQAVLWAGQGHRLRMAVNVSPLQLRHPRFIAVLEEVLTESGLDAAQLTLELTERTLIERDADMIERLKRIRALGVELSLDDFGTGYCGLAYLKGLPVDTLKIDRAFVRDLAEDTADQALVAAILQLSQTLGKNVVAEGVEHAAQAHHLLRLGCHRMQGFLFGMPEAADAWQSRLDRFGLSLPPR